MMIRILVMLLAAVTAAALPVADRGRHTVSFQEGMNGYAGTIDTEIWLISPTTILDGNPNATSDGNNDGGESQVLVCFENIIGDKSGQIPPKATIHSARLIISAFDQGTTVHLHRILVPWKRTATWNSLVGGVTADGLEASKQKDSFTFGKHISDPLRGHRHRSGVGERRREPRLGVHQHRRQRVGLLYLRVRGHQATPETDCRVHGAQEVAAQYATTSNRSTTD
jgi:hypothetical protein